MKILVVLAIGLCFLFGANGDKAYFKMKKEAYYYYEHSREGEAFKIVESFLKKYPQNIRAQNLLAVFHYWNGDKLKAKKILEKIVKREKFAPALELLSKINASIAPKKSLKKDKNKTALKQRRERIENNLSEDLAFLLSYIEKNPLNIVDRKFLANYYLSANDEKNALKMAKEVLKIDPNDIEMLMLLKKAGVKPPQRETAHQMPSEIRDKAIFVLNRYTRNKEFRRFINLYMVLIDKGEYIPGYIHLDALNAAVELKEYSLAKKIILENDFPNTKHLKEFQALIDEKLRFSSFM